MRKIIILTLMSLGLTGGVALADGRHEARRPEPAVRDHRGAFERGFERGRNERVEHFNDRRVKPAIRFERHENRAGFRWVGGDWQWNGYEWIWMPGHYIRIGWR